MPIHDWTRVDAGIFHDFHHTWITEIRRALIRGLLPPEYYALVEQVAGGLGPDVLTLKRPSTSPVPPGGSPAGTSLATAPPRAEFRLRGSEVEQYAAKAKAVVIRHRSNHQVVAVIEVVSPGNKNNRHGLRSFVSKALELLDGGVHLLIIDLFPPGPRDPQGIQKAIWDELSENDFVLPEGTPLSLGAYIAGQCPDAFIRTAAVGRPVPEMPLFLEPDIYIPLDLEPTYQAAWADVPPIWQEVLTGPAGA